MMQNYEHLDASMELDAIAGNDGEKHLRGEGKQTAAEYERAVKKLVEERTLRETDAEQHAIKLVEGESLQTDEGCRVIAEVLCQALKDGVVHRGFVISKIISNKLFPAGPEVSKDSTARDEADIITATQKAANDFMKSGSTVSANTLRSQIITFLGALYLNVFIASNWTGPPLKLPCSPLPAHAILESDESIRGHFEQLCREAMEADSEVNRHSTCTQTPGHIQSRLKHSPESLRLGIHPSGSLVRSSGRCAYPNP
jgi:hypothetical protein